MIPFGMENHHISARQKFGKHIGQILMICDYNKKYSSRLILEPIDEYFTDLHAMKLTRQLTDAFNEGEKLQTWEKTSDLIKTSDLTIYHAKYSGGNTYIFLSTTTKDFQIGFLPRMEHKDNQTLGNLICHMLNGHNISRFKITPNGDVIDEMESG